MAGPRHLTALGTNIDLSGLAGPESETSIAVSPDDPNVLMAGSNAPSVGPMVAFLSTDGGQTWSQSDLPLDDSLGETGNQESDPQVVATPDGAFHYSFILVGAGANSASVVVATYRPGGWATPVVVDPGISGGYFDDKPMLAAGPTGDLYAAWTENFATGSNQGIELSASKDGGTTWSAPVRVDSPSSGSQRVLYAELAPMPGDAGVYVVWDDYGLRAPQSVLLGALCSWQAGSLACGTPVQVGVSNVNLEGPGSYTGAYACDGSDGGSCYAIPPQPDRGIAAAPSVVADAAGDVFAVWDTAPALPPAASSTYVVFNELQAGHTNWPTSPTLLSTNSSTSADYAFFPWIAYDSTTGDLAVSYYSTAGTATNEDVYEYLTYSYNDGATWQSPLTVSTAVSDEGPSVTGSDPNDYGDYEGLAVAQGVAHPAWTDARSLPEQVYTASAPLTPVPTLGGTSTQTDLSWPAVPGASSYTVFAGSPLTALGTVSGTTYSAGQSDQFAVQADISNQSPAVPTIPAAPSLWATARPAAGTVDLGWPTVAGAVYYAVYQGGTDIGGSYTGAFTVGGLQAATTYEFAVTPVGLEGDGPSSSTVSATTAPAAPSGLQGTAQGSSAVAMVWQSVDGATSYHVYLTGSSGVPVKVGSTTSTSFTATGLAASTAYTYTVAAVDGASPDSAPSNAVTVTTAAATVSGGGSGGGGGSSGGGGGGGGGGGSGSSGGSTTAPPGTTALTGQNIGAAIQQAGTAANVTVDLTPASTGVATLTLSGGALSALKTAGKGVTATVGAVSISLPSEDLGTSALSLQIAPVPQAQLTLGAGETAAGGGVTLDLSLTASGGGTPALPRPVRLTLPYTGSGPVAIYWINAPGGPEAVPGVASGGFVTADLHHFSTYAPVTVASSFTDTAGSWAAADIAGAAAQGLVQGVGNGLFEPDGIVTRAQLAQLLTRALAVPAAPPAATPFGDVAPDAWYAAAVAAAQNAGLMEGVGSASFAPNQAVTREQLATTLARALAYLGGSYVLPAFRAAASTYADAGRIDPWASQAATYVAEVGLMRGLPGGLFDPLAPVTRAQAAAVLVRLVGLIEGSPIR
jgi:hypothetical protein